MPLVAPQLVVALSYNSTALNISWKPIQETREHVRGKLIGHRVCYIYDSIIYLFIYITNPIFRLSIGRRIASNKNVYIIYHEQQDHGHSL